MPLTRIRPFAAIALLLAAAAAAAAPATGQVLRRGGGVEPDTLDPHKAQTLEIGLDLYEGLAVVAPGGAIVPGAAARWELSADGREYVFRLRPEGRWSTGEPVFAADFVAGLRRAVAPATGSPYAQLLAPIENAPAIFAGRLPPERLGVEALDDLTLRIRLAQPTPYFTRLLVMPVAAPLHRPSFEAHGEGFARPGRLVGNGAYALADWVLHSHVTLVRNPHYWNDAATQIDTVRHVATEDQGAELARYRAGELDVTYRFPFNQIRALSRQLAPGEIRADPYLHTAYVSFNCTAPPFAGKPGLRRALAMVIDREAIAGKLLHGLAVAGTGFVPPATAGHAAQVPPWLAWPAEQRIAEAQRLYREAGYGDARPLELELRYYTRDDHRRMAVVIAALWKQRLGVRVRLVNEEFKVFLANARSRNGTQAVLIGWNGDYDDPTTFLDLLRAGNGFNYAGWNEPRYDALMDAAAAAADAEQRRALLGQAEQLLLAEAPVAPLYHSVARRLVKPHVRNWTANILDFHYTRDLALGPPP
jgi:oligopeptide transport system substrate-binding protein